MSVIPRTLVDRIQFFETHLPVWTKNPAAIGLTVAQLADLGTRTQQARLDYDAARALRTEAKAATSTQNDSVASMFELGSDLVKTIRAFAETNDDLSVYNLAQIPAPAAPMPTPPPETPTDVQLAVNAFGYCTIKWKGSRAVGSQFILRRQVTEVGGTPGPWTYAGSSVTNDYTDPTVPTGLASVSYLVFAQRASGTSELSNIATLTFGTGLVTNTSSEGLSLAA